MHYGGFVTGVERKKVSLLDPRTKDEVASAQMTGGDRMYHHLYASKYAKYLNPFIQNEERITLAEVGILKGSGLAFGAIFFQKVELWVLT